MFELLKSDTFRRVLTFFRLRLADDGPPGSPGDPYAWTPARLKPRPNLRSGAVALKEPDPEYDSDHQWTRPRRLTEPSSRRFSPDE